MPEHPLALEGLDGASSDWREKPLFGSDEKERAAFARWWEDTQETQRKAASKQRLPIKRAFHAKGTGARAKFDVYADLPAELQVGLFRPGATYDAFVRFSNVMSEVRTDSTKDQRAIAVKVHTGETAALLTGRSGDEQDFLLCDTPVSFARDANDFMSTVTLLINRWTFVPRLIGRLRLRALLVLYRLLVDFIWRSPGVRVSYATQTYWTRLPVKFKDFAAQFKAVPRRTTPKEASGTGDSYLRDDLNGRINTGKVEFDFYIALFSDEKRTPIENGTKEWKTYLARPIARLSILPQDLNDEQLQETTERMEFTPWHTTADFRPLGSMNRARLSVYQASQALRA